MIYDSKIITMYLAYDTNVRLKSKLLYREDYLFLVEAWSLKKDKLLIIIWNEGHGHVHIATLA